MVKDSHDAEHATLRQVAPLVTNLSLTVIYPGILCDSFWETEMHGLDSIEILDVTGCATVIYYT